MRKAEKFFLRLILLLLFPMASFAQTGHQQITDPETNIRIDSSFKTDSAVDSMKLIGISDSVFIVRDIVLEGNKRTRRIIILRELPFKKGDSIMIKDFPKTFNTGATQILNTSLFHEASISVVKFDAPYVDIKVTVYEKWYIFPFPHFKPVDRNISQWLFEKGANLSRVDYGIKLMYDNVTGNKDNLRFFFVTGYTKQFMLSYNRPYIDKSMKWGVSFDIAVGKTREINYNTLLDKQVFLKDKDYIRNFFNGNIEFTYRPAFFTRHKFGIAYNFLRIGDTIQKLNPDYFRNGGNKVNYPEIYYLRTYQNLDYNPYPTKGYATQIFFGRQGWNNDVNVWRLITKGVGYWPITKSAFYTIGGAASLTVPFKQPYYNSQLLGYGDMNLRGYEYYVIDGVAGGVINATIAQQFADFKLHIPHTKWLTPRLIPFKMYAKTYGNVAYAYNPQPGNNRLANKLVFGGGIGIDIVTLYDFNLKIEFSFNQLGQNGIYLQKKSMFQ